MLILTSEQFIDFAAQRHVVTTTTRQPLIAGIRWLLQHFQQHGLDLPVAFRIHRWSHGDGESPLEHEWGRRHPGAAARHRGP
ncbi:MAG: hypothetical protein MUE46_20890 [Xanthomonadales bacterium]|nr:hypothetical protein [Xanthomonadales bacterium]